MKNEAIKKFIYSFWEYSLDDVKPRLKNFDFLKKDYVNDIVGPKRSGKTYFMFSIVKMSEKELGRNQFIYLNCEHRSLYPLKIEDLNYLVEFIHWENLLKEKVFLLLDEIQTVKNWEIFVKSIYDEFKGKIKVIVSGSTRSVLSEDYGKLLTGRHETIKIFPLSFKECLAFKNIEYERITEEKEAKIKKHFFDYVKFGGFPKYVLTEDKDYLNEVFSDIIERDIKSRLEIRKKMVIDELASLLLERVSSKISFRKLRNILREKGHNISTDIVIRYINAFNDVFLFFLLPKYSSKFSEIVKSQKKVFVLDNGFVSIFPARISENLGKLMENCVLTEFLKFGLDVGKNVFYHESSSGEVDFVIKEGLKVKQLIQVTYASSKDEVEKREIKALVKASNELKCKDLLIITWDYEDEVKVKNKKIVFKPLWKWLLEK